MIASGINVNVKQNGLFSVSICAGNGRSCSAPQSEYRFESCLQSGHIDKGVSRFCHFQPCRLSYLVSATGRAYGKKWGITTRQIRYGASFDPLSALSFIHVIFRLSGC